MNSFTYSQIIIGSIAIVAFLFILCAVVLIVTASVMDKIFIQYFEKGQQAQWEIDNRRMREAAHWFGEDPPTKDLILDLSEGRDVSDSRNIWRNARKLNQPKS